MRRGAAAGAAGKAPVFTFSGASAGPDDGGVVGSGAEPMGGNGSKTMTGVAPGGGWVAGVDDASGGPARMAHRAVASDVTLQLLVSNNVYFSVCWWVATVVATFVKTGGAREDFDEIRPVMIAMYMIFEPIR